MALASRVTLKSLTSLSLSEMVVIDVSFVCEFKGSSRASGGWNNGVRHSDDVIQARAKVKNNMTRTSMGS